MRPIKFRAWDKKEKKWWGGGAIYLNPIGNTPHTYAILEEVSEHLEVEQFTGLLDKNGKEIYEGDVVRFESTPIGKSYEVFWEEAEAMFLIAPNGDRQAKATSFLRGSMTVIGNTHENPELLKS